jgi:galactitol-specific phosphotransferase system IIB component
MEEAIEKLLKAKNLGIDVEGFSIDQNTVYLHVEDDHDDDLIVELAEFKNDYKDKDKIYNFKVLNTEYSWENALNHSADVALERFDIANNLKATRIRERLAQLEKI